jgi:hypothetical protein
VSPWPLPTYHSKRSLIGEDGEPVSIRLTVAVHKRMDEGLYKFIEKFASLPPENGETIDLCLIMSATEEKTVEELENSGNGAWRV